MSYSRRSRFSHSPSPYGRYGRSVSRSLSRSRSMSCESSDVENPGNNLYVTGLSHRITKRELEDYFSSEGKVVDVHLVVDPWTRESRGFGFVTMSSVKEADRCIKYLDRSVLEGRVITVEKARRRRGRTPTPGKYLGLRTVRVRHRSTSNSPYRRSCSRSYSSEDGRRSYSPHYSHRRSYSPYYSRRRSYSYYYGRQRSFSRSSSPYSRSPVCRRERSYSPFNSYYSGNRYYRERRYHRSVSRSISPGTRHGMRHGYSRSDSYSRRSYSRSISPGPRRSYRRSSRRSYSRSISPRPRRSYRRSYSRSFSPRPRRSYSRSISPRPRSHRRSYSRDSLSSRSRYSKSRSASPSRSVTPRSSSPSH